MPEPTAVPMSDTAAPGLISTPQVHSPSLLPPAQPEQPSAADKADNAAVSTAELSVQGGEGLSSLTAGQGGDVGGVREGVSAAQGGQHNRSVSVLSTEGLTNEASPSSTPAQASSTQPSTETPTAAASDAAATPVAAAAPQPPQTAASCQSEFGEFTEAPIVDSQDTVAYATTAAGTAVHGSGDAVDTTAGGTSSVRDEGGVSGANTGAAAGAGAPPLSSGTAAQPASDEAGVSGAGAGGDAAPLPERRSQVDDLLSELLGSESEQPTPAATPEPGVLSGAGDKGAAGTTAEDDNMFSGLQTQ